ncbi:MAG: dTMP kinase [Acidimicrobiales bacterium]|nr:dTMP kinase [Actinomycetota bacterium]
MRGRLIAFEGGEGSGKSTQARLLATRMDALLTHEPGGTALGRGIRNLVLDPSAAGIDDRAEALLMAADRAQHVAEVIRPALDRGQHVVTDRFSGSTMAYQGYGRGLDLAELARLSAWSAGGIEADLVVLLDVPLDVAAARRSQATDRMEAQDEDFHARVTAGYRELAAADPERWSLVDGCGSVEDVAARVLAVVLTGLEPPAGPM